ncbi:MAG: type II-A CRISPR-associated protein Csn2 [Clostridia bacterium]|nr:type II-A CRISPR-associated protein Csn2 [Clostridia bacterium]
MKLSYPEFSEVITIDGSGVPCIIIESRSLLRTFICDILSAIEGAKNDLVLSDGGQTLDPPKSIEVITDFVHFDMNKKALLNKVVTELERVALSAEHYLEAHSLLQEIERAINDWSFSFPCDIVPSKVSVSALLKSVGIELRDEYEGHRGEVEKILDYMELVREFDRDKLFITVNMRAFFDDSIISQFQKTALSHGFKLLMIEAHAYNKLDFEKRTVIDTDLCEF